MTKLRRIVVQVAEPQHNGIRVRAAQPALLRTVLIITCFVATTDALAATYDYSVTLSEDLARADIEARFPNGVASVPAQAPVANRFVTAARDCESGAALAVGARSIRGDQNIRCLAYSVDLQKAAASGRLNARLDRGSLLLPVDHWMWRPRLGGDDEVIITFDLPEGVRASVPWPPVDGSADTYRLLSSPQSGTGLSLFGRFDEERVQVGGSDLRIAIVPVRGVSVGPEVIEWTRQTAGHLELAYGRFPNPYVRVLLFDALNPDTGAAVQFGRVVRDGGETVELLVNSGQSEERFLGDWTATHEFAHLLLPKVAHAERWISEGFAQYYQNVLLARAGHYTEHEAWLKIADGLQRGMASAPSLSPNGAAKGDWRDTRMKVYWSGAALFLLADVELRRQSGGQVSLDTVLDRFQACCLPSRRTWKGRELFDAFDALIDEPLFADLYARYADTAGFPPYSTVLGQLGVVPGGATVSLRDDANLAEIRTSIMARRYTGEPGT